MTIKMKDNISKASSTSVSITTSASLTSTTSKPFITNYTSDNTTDEAFKCICLAHAIRSFATRSWKFFLPLYLSKSCGSLRATAAMALAKNLAVVSLSTTAANFYHSTSNPFVKATILENIAVVLGGALLSLFAYTSNEIVCEAPFASSLFGIAIICACIDAVATSLLTTILSKEWVAVLFPNSHALASANARLSQIDLLAATLSPILVSSILELGGYSVVLSLLISQHALGAFVILRQIDRAVKLKPQLVIASTEKGGLRKDSGSFNPFCIFMDNVVPLRAKLVTASFVLLYFTVLSSGAVMTAWLNSSHTHQQTIAWFGSACNLVGAFATVAAPPLIRRVGKFHAGVLAQLGQCACCIMASLAFYRSSNNAVFLIFVVASRMGVYVFDLAERQILQESVPRLRQTIFLSTERGLRELALFGMMYLSYWHSKPESFGILVNFSTAASILSSFLLAIALCK